MFSFKEQQLEIPWHRPAGEVPAHPAIQRMGRFMLTGALSGVVQMCLLDIFFDARWPAIPASFIAAFAGAQLNFVLSTLITWSDRPAAVLWRRWLLYLGSVSGTMVLNVLIFSLLHLICPEDVAAASAIVLTGIANFLLADKVVFRQRLIQIKGISGSSNRPWRGRLQLGESRS
jgi:putative flippase GtrA